MQKILGLDIGTYSIKAVIIWNDYKIINDYKNYLVHQLIEKKIEYKEGLSEKEAQTQAIDALIKEYNIEFDLVFAAIDAKNVSIRKVDFQNIRKRDIVGFLENELESSSPFAIEETILDYQIIDYTKNRSSVLAVLVKKDVIRDILEIIEKEHLRVKVLDIDNLTYLNMLSFLDKDPELPEHIDDNTNQQQTNITASLIINIGHSKTTLTFLADKKVLYTRIISIAGDYFNQVLKQKLNIEYPEAEILKHYVSSMETFASEDANSKRNLVSIILADAISELGIEILRTIQSFQVKENIQIQTVFISGGSSKIKGIKDYLHIILKVPVSNIRIKKENFMFEDDEHSDYGGVDSLATFSQALAISMRGLPVIGIASKVNLRKGEFAQISNYDKLIKQIFLYASAAAIVLVCLFISYFIRSILYNQEIDTLKAQFRKDVISMANGEPYSLRAISSKKDWDFKNYGNEAINFLKQNMKDKEKIVENYSSASPSLALNVMSQVSRAIPKELYFEVSEFRIQDDQLYIEAETNSPENLNKIIDKLSKMKELSQVTKKSQSNKLGSDKKIIHFAVSAAVNVGEG
ncbi:pilus assembly protein PilM [Pigmentibacter ruber]